MISHLHDNFISLLRQFAIFVFAALSVLPSDDASAQVVPSADLGKGVNFGNMLEAPFEGAWELTVEPEFFTRVVEAGFDHIRLPVSWTYHALTEPPYTVDLEFFDRIDEVLAMAEAVDVKVILNDHHHDELDENPIAESPRFLAIWDQIATRYADRGDWLLFEILNEPHGMFTQNPELWNALQSDTLDIIRATNPTRKVLIAPVDYNSINKLELLEIPDDSNLIASVHYYAPFDFTHQGAPWINPLPPTGVAWGTGYFDFANPWQNYSWNTKVDSTGAGFRVTYQQGWSGFAANIASPIANPQAVQFRINRPYRLQVIAIDGDDQIAYPIQSTATPGNEKMYTVNFDNLPPGFELRQVAIQNYTPERKIPMIISVLRIKQNDTWSYVMTTKTNVQRLDFQVARDWAIENNIPLHLGEFGAYSEGNEKDRVKWTRSVRNVANKQGIDWTYWEFGTPNFGIYDPVNQVWRTNLLRALLPFSRP